MAEILMKKLIMVMLDLVIMFLTSVQASDMTSSLLMRVNYLQKTLIILLPKFA